MTIVYFQGNPIYCYISASAVEPILQCITGAAVPPAPPPHFRFPPLRPCLNLDLLSPPPGVACAFVRAPRISPPRLLLQVLRWRRRTLHRAPVHHGSRAGPRPDAPCRGGTAAAPAPRAGRDRGGVGDQHGRDHRHVPPPPPGGRPADPRSDTPFLETSLRNPNPRNGFGSALG
jgi:hypothetical protein